MYNTGRLEDARRRFAALTEHQDPLTRRRARYFLALTLFRMGRLAEALKQSNAYRAVYGEDVDWVELHYRHAEYLNCARRRRGARDPGRHREPLPDELLGGRGAPAARLPGSGIRGRRIVSATSPRTHRAGGCVVHVPVWCDDWRASKFNLLTHNLSKLFRRPTG